jgi:hypothetical protein
LLHLWETRGWVTEVARRLCAARSSVHRWRAAYEELEEAGIAPQVRGRADRKATEELLGLLDRLVRQMPTELGYLYVDEADIALNSRIGAAWMPRSKQVTVPTPGKNRTHYVTGALHARTRRVVWVEYTAKSSVWFIALAKALLCTHRGALILDNFITTRTSMN